MRSASRTILTVLVAILVLSPVVAAAQVLPGATADERAINGAAISANRSFLTATAEITLSFSFCSINSKSAVTSSGENGSAFSI